MTPNFLPLPGIGPKTLEKLNKLKIHNSNDLLYHFPHRYIDFSRIQKISQLQPNSCATVTGKIIRFQNIYTKTHKNLQIVTLADSSGHLDLVWFNQAYLSTIFKPNTVFSFAGEVGFFNRHLVIFNPEYGQYHTGKIIAVYPETKGLSSRWFRKTIGNHIKALVAGVIDPLPPPILQKYQLLDLKSALTTIHQPTNATTLQQARLRLSLDEILSLQSQSILTKSHWLTKTPSHPLHDFPENIKQFIQKLPFKLTPSQLQAWDEIKTDLLSDHLANRLLVGDVGSGKTVVAALASLLTSLNQQKSLILVPTNILAQQHYQTFKNLFPKHLIKLLTSQSKLNLKHLTKNTIVIATHAAIHHQSDLSQVALLIVDEEHKFGVKQRNFLSSLAHPPHCLTMSATPIRRSVSLTFLKHLDLSNLNPFPHHQTPKTFLVPNPKTINCYHWLKSQIKTHKTQAFIVCPFITESETLQSVKSATKEFDHLSKIIFPNLKLALVHGKTKPETRNQIIQKFQRNQINILVTTPIIEVGIDIPNASTIIIQSADRFGLAQLHQLRGRVGRGNTKSYCYLFTESDNDKALARLKFLTKYSDGQKIANYDLATRGPGEAFSTLQHGFPSLKLADLSNLKLIAFAQKILDDLLEHNPDFDLHQLVKVT